MLPSSEDLEKLWGDAKKLAAELGKLAGAEVKKTSLKQRLADLAREWLRLSPALRAAAICPVERLDRYDGAMSELLTSTTKRARASALKKKLDPFVEAAIDDVVVPVIQFEGSPRQVAGRQIVAEFASSLSADEIAYVQEAGRCVAVQAYRAAIIMLWAGAIARLHAAVIRLGFDAYNSAVDTLTPKKGQPFNRINAGSKISSLPELQRSRDADVLVVGMELFGYDLQVFKELDRLLGARNDAAHPGMGDPGALDAQQFATKLRSLVFDRVPA